jgi:hypothetical protein
VKNADPNVTKTRAPVDDSLAAILPDSAQWSAALGYRVRDEGWTNHVAGPDRLLMQDGLGQWSGRECIGVVLPALKSVYGWAPVNAFIGTMVSDVTADAIQFASAADAQALFAKFTDQWRQCQGKTVVQRNTNDTYIQDIATVAATDTVLSAAKVGQVPPNQPMPAERALGVAASCIIEVEAQGNPQPANAPVGDNLAVSLVKLMQSKSAEAKC